MTPSDSKPDSKPGRKDTDAVLVDAKDIVRCPKLAFVFKADCKRFVGSPADMTMKHANTLLPKVACTNKGGHKYYPWYGTENKLHKIWSCILKCTFCELRIESRCAKLEVGMARRLSRRIRGVRVNRDLRNIYIHYANMKRKRLVT